MPLVPGTYGNAVWDDSTAVCASLFDFGYGSSECLTSETANFSIDALVYDDAGAVVRFLGTFEQTSCDGNTGAVVGYVSYTADGG